MAPILTLPPLALSTEACRPATGTCLSGESPYGSPPDPGLVQIFLMRCRGNLQLRRTFVL